MTDISTRLLCSGRVQTHNSVNTALTVVRVKFMLTSMSWPEPNDLNDLQILISALDGIAEAEQTGDNSEAAATQRIEIAAELKNLSDEVLRRSVAQARTHNVSWQQIGDVLDISRQAAFQRFRDPTDPKGNTSMKTMTNTSMIPSAEAVYRNLESGDYDSIGQQMTFIAQRILNEDRVMGVWAEATAMVGTLESVGESFARPSGSNIVVETPLAFEAGELVGRIAYNRRNKIVGMLIMRPEDIDKAKF